MPENLFERYSHLRYKAEPLDDSGFVDFLYENTEISPSDPDVDTAWNSFTRRLTQGKHNSNSWIRIASSVIVIIGVSIFVWNISTAPEQLNIASSNEKINVTFPDGSTGVLNKNSTFSFPEKFGSERLVSFAGEAYFDIKKREKLFVIDAGGVEVKVLGTAFNLITTDKEVEVFVERGLVAFEKNGEQTKIEAGLKAIFDKKDNSVLIIENPSPNVISWKNSQLEFNDIPFIDAIKDLEEYFEVEIKLQNEQIGNCRITVSFDKSPLADVISTIESILDIKMTQSDKVIEISGQGCQRLPDT